MLCEWYLLCWFCVIMFVMVCVCVLDILWCVSMCNVSVWILLSDRMILVVWLVMVYFVWGGYVVDVLWYV